MSDNTDPYDDLLMTHAFSHAYALKTTDGLGHGRASRLGEGSARVPLSRRMLGSMGIGADLPSGKEKTARLPETIARYKRCVTRFSTARSTGFARLLEHPVSAFHSLVKPGRSFLFFCAIHATAEKRCACNLAGGANTLMRCRPGERLSGRGTHAKGYC